jgi:putative spermidine/putrescine transport system permease protein
MEQIPEVEGMMRSKILLKMILGSLAILISLPVLVLAYLSLARQWSFPALFDASFSLENWALAMGGTQGLLASLGTSILLAGSIAICSTLLGFWTSRHLMYDPLGRKLIQVAYYPYLIAPVILGVMLRYYFIKMGLSGTFLGVWLAQFIFIYPYAVLYFSGFWTNLIQAMEGQAKTLGANGLQIFFKVLLPSAKEWLLVCIFQTLMISWFEYGLTQYVGIGKVPTLTIRTMQFVKEANPHFAAVAACMMVFPLLAFALLNSRYLYRNTEQHD